MNDQMTIEQFGAQIKQKYPEYSSYSDSDIGNRMLQKYPVYQSRITQDQPQVTQTQTQSPGFLDSVKSTLAPVDQKLSNMPGTLGFVGSSIYNGAKGLVGLVGSAGLDLISAVNHPIDSGKNVAEFIKGEANGGANPDSLDTLGKVVQGTFGSSGVLGAAQGFGTAEKDYLASKDIQSLTDTGMKSSDLAFKYFEAAKNESDPAQKQKLLDLANSYHDRAMEIVNAQNELSKGNATPKQMVGKTLNAVLTLLTIGEGNLGAQATEKMVEHGLITKSVGQVLKTAATSYPGIMAQSGALNAGFQVGSNLQHDRPVTEGVGQAFGTGAAIPIVAKTLGAGIKKVTPDISIEDGANQLKKTIGFRGTNPAEKAQFDKAAPVVFKALKDSGFELTSKNDPNNIVNLSKSIHDLQTDILKERTARIEAAGGDASVSGSLAADKIRSLVEPGSVEDLTNPGLVDRLDVIAKNFDNKKYTPVEAQKAIVQANSGFSFSDNQAMADQIKMAISQAFTPELDRIVRGAKEVKYDEKGKPVVEKGGTAELNKKWSALETFNKQLQKKLIIEERKANYSLPDRLTGAQIAGKIGEAVGNPMKVPEKVVGSSFEWIANKVIGDRNNVNYRLYRAFNGSPMSMAIIGMLNKFKQAEDLVKFLKQNPLLQNILAKLVPTDPTLHAEENLIPRNGGFIRNPLTGKEVLNMSDFHPEDRNLLVDVATRIKNKEAVSVKEIDEAKATLKHYDFNAPSSKTKLAEFILNADNSASQAEMFSQMDRSLKSTVGNVK